MSAMPEDYGAEELQQRQHPADAREEDPTPAPNEAVATPSSAADPGVDVRRSVVLSAPIAAAAAVVGAGYLYRAATSGAVLDWVVSVVLGVLASLHAIAVFDARSPLLVADELGVRIRLGKQWRGLPWDAVAQVVVEPRTGPLRDGRVLILPHSLGRALDALDGGARRQAARNQRRCGAALAVPLGLVTRVSTAGERALADRLAELSGGRTDVIALHDREPGESMVAQDGADRPPTADPDQHAPTRHALAVLGTAVSRLARGRSHDVDVEGGTPGQVDASAAAPQPAPQPALPPALPLRQTRPGIRAEATTAAVAEPDESESGRLVEERQLRRPGGVDLEFEPLLVTNVRPLAVPGDALEPLVLGDFETQPAYDPVIGPELAAARHRLGLSVDEVADRTRIRPHVIEAIEVDDFAPCGGDVYSRGHLRALARFLNLDPAPLIATFDNRYATAPISARRVFEAELATGMTGSMRSTVGGANWTLLVTAVLLVALVWGVVRLFSSGPNEMTENPPPLPSSQEQWPPRVYDPPKHPTPVAQTVPLKLVAVNAPTRVRVTTPDGTVHFDRTLVYGEALTIRVPRPFAVWAADAGALNVTVARQDQGLLGEADQPASKDFGGTADR